MGSLRLYVLNGDTLCTFGLFILRQSFFGSSYPKLMCVVICFFTRKVRQLFSAKLLCLLLVKFSFCVPYIGRAISSASDILILSELLSILVLVKVFYFLRILISTLLLYVLAMIVIRGLSFLL